MTGTNVRSSWMAIAAGSILALLSAVGCQSSPSAVAPGGSTSSSTLGVVRDWRTPNDHRFQVLWGLLYDEQSFYRTEKSPATGEARTTEARYWGALLYLISGTKTPQQEEIRFLWLFPISRSPGGA
jgi:hypothetical protein